MPSVTIRDYGSRIKLWVVQKYVQDGETLAKTIVHEMEPSGKKIRLRVLAIRKNPKIRVVQEIAEQDYLKAMGKIGEVRHVLDVKGDLNAQDASMHRIWGAFRGAFGQGKE